MGLLDMDPFGGVDPITGKKKKTSAQKRRSALTQAMKTRIKEAVGYRCEVVRCSSKPYDVHHIKPVSKGGRNVGSNLIALCANHHRDAHSGALTQADMRKLVSKRSAKAKKEITQILSSRKKVKKTTKKDPFNPFGGSSFFGGTGKKRGRKKKDDIFGGSLF